MRDVDMDGKVSFKEFANLFEFTIESYEKKGWHMDVSSLADSSNLIL